MLREEHLCRLFPILLCVWQHRQLSILQSSENGQENQEKVEEMMVGEEMIVTVTVFFTSLSYSTILKVLV
jgi:hypothetical protein